MDNFDMQTVSATKASQNFAAMLDAAQREPVRIQRHERNVAVLISSEEYERMNRERWAEFNRLSASAAAEAKANGLTEEILAEILAEA
jgi:prevent-host-death family protein